jgi:hypothetical protein
VPSPLCERHSERRELLDPIVPGNKMPCRSTAIPIGFLNWPGADPSVPHCASGAPVGENFWMRLFPP